jgi:hypothetical protein
VLDRTCDRGHGRVEVPTLKAVIVNHFGFPHPAQSSRSPAPPGTCALWPHPGGGGP